jgi:hypothetical protein
MKSSPVESLSDKLRMSGIPESLKRGDTVIEHERMFF